MSDVKINDHSEEYKKAMQEAVGAALEAIGIQAEGYAKLELENNPRRIDTGLLRNSITYAVSGQPAAIHSYHGDNPSKYSKKEAVPIGFYNGVAPDDSDDKKAVYIGSNVQYAPYVHEGTGGIFGLFFKKMKPNRFLKNAIQKHTDEYKAIVGEYIEKGLKEVKDK